MNRVFRSLAFAFAAALLSGGARALTTSEIYANIDTWRSTAETIVVDGDLSDWGTIPFFNDPTGDAGGDTSRDVIATAAAPLDQQILIAIETEGPPAIGAQWSALIDLQGDLFPDVLLMLDTSAAFQTLLVLDQASNVIASGAAFGIEIALSASSIELRIPYSSLVPVLPAPLVAAIQSANHRSWVRLRVDSTSAPGVSLDASRSVGSYRLIATPYDLDPPHPTAGIDNPGLAPIEMAFPMDGRWLLGQGPNGFTTHAGFWMYDYVQMDEDFSTSNPPMSANNDDYYAFGAPVFAPLSGTVTSAIESRPDNVPGSRTNFNNEVLIDDGTGWLTRLFHFMQNSIPVTTSQTVSEGDMIGLVGNSGNSGEAHMHLDTFGIGATSGSRPIAHPYVDVVLNPSPFTPWRRSVALWEPRSGMFIEAAEPGLGVALAAGAVGLACRVRRRRRSTRQRRRSDATTRSA